jgi:hydroxyacylglutathione hydrolase
MTQIEVYQFPCRSDNFGVLVHDAQSGLTASIDAPEAAAVARALDDKGWQLSHIFVTHHHADHTEGVMPLKAQSGCAVIGPAAERSRIDGLDQAYGDGERFMFGSHEVHVLDTPGHTLCHITYWMPGAEVVFCGDTLFSMGCGRVFEGTPAQMWHSLQKIMALPATATIYCGHEYTQANAAFALSIEPGNDDLRARAAEVAELRAQGRPTLPTTLARELATNPFLRPDSAEIQSHLNMSGAPLDQVWAEIRRRKDRY